VDDLASIGSRATAWLIDGVILTVPYLALHAALGTAGIVIGYVLASAYWVALEGGRSGQTLGKRAVGARVRAPHGGSVGYARALVRIVVKTLIPITYIWAARRDRRCLHDHAAGSVVQRA